MILKYHQRLLFCNKYVHKIWIHTKRKTNPYECKMVDSKDKSWLVFYCFREGEKKIAIAQNKSIQMMNSYVIWWRSAWLFFFEKFHIKERQLHLLPYRKIEEASNIRGSRRGGHCPTPFLRTGTSLVACKN